MILLKNDKSLTGHKNGHGNDIEHGSQMKSAATA